MQPLCSALFYGDVCSVWSSATPWSGANRRVFFFQVLDQVAEPSAQSIVAGLLLRLAPDLSLSLAPDFLMSLALSRVVSQPLCAAYWSARRLPSGCWLGLLTTARRRLTETAELRIHRWRLKTSKNAHTSRKIIGVLTTTLSLEKCLTSRPTVLNKNSVFFRSVWLLSPVNLNQ